MDLTATWDELLLRHPLVAFSIYTDIQSRTIRELGNEILSCLESGITPSNDPSKPGTCDGDVLSRGYPKFWLWVLGAYEVVRTMCQAEQCFSTELVTELRQLKRQLATIRMPFAKQELPGQRFPTYYEPSITGIRDSPADLRFQVKGQEISARELISEFERVFGKIRRADVIDEHRSSYGSGKK